MRYGIDISRYQHPQGAAIDYGRATAFLKWVSGGEQPFVFINSASPEFVADRAGFTAAGALVASYYFADPTMDAIVAEQEFRLGVGSMPGALDLETIAPGGWHNTAVWGEEWLTQPRESNSLLYTNLNFLTNMVFAPWGRKIWFAGTQLPPHPYTDLVVCWQYSAIAIPGIQGLVDINKWVGTDAQFGVFFGVQPAVVPPSSTGKPPPGLPVRKRWWWPWNWGGRA